MRKKKINVIARLLRRYALYILLVLFASVSGFSLGFSLRFFPQKEIKATIVNTTVDTATIVNRTVIATAYNSLENQTDSSPWITASGTRCHSGVIACNFLPIGTKVWIKGFGKQAFTVEDRMHKRFSDRIDIWFADYEDAIKFGKRRVIIAYWANANGKLLYSMR